MRVAAYIRVSTDEQADKGNSIFEQVERLTAYCKAMAWNDPVFFIDDGYSAKDLRRPEIQKLLDRVNDMNFDIVLTSKLDRLCRNLLDLLQLVEIFTAKNCSYVSASESFDTSTAVGRMTLQLLGTFAEFERERISERVKDNMLSIAKNTDKAITSPCYGYDIVDGKYVINQEEALNVLYMFDLAVQNHGHRMIAKLLNDKGVTTKRGKMWDQTNVKRLMNNETLMGTMIYNKRENRKGKMIFRDESDWIIKENNHQPIITPEQFKIVQDIMASRSRARRHADSETYLLTGLVKCGHCERNMKGSTSRHKNKYGEYTYYRYICASYVQGYGCKHHAVHRDDLEQLIIDEIKSLSTRSTKNIKINIANQPSINEQLKFLNEQLSKVDRKMQKQIEAFENELISAEDLKKARTRVEAERNSLREEVARIESTNRGNPEDLKKKAEGLIGDITGIDRPKAKQALRLLIDHIDIKDSELISITWKL